MKSVHSQNKQEVISGHARKEHKVHSLHAPSQLPSSSEKCSESAEMTLSTEPSSRPLLESFAIDAISRHMLQSNVDLSSLQVLLNESMTIFYTDTGGQPEFHEVLPALVAGPTIFLLVFNLNQPLDSKYEVLYESSSKNYEIYKSSFSVREVLMQCLSSITSYHSAQLREFTEQTSLKCGAPPTIVLAIGTHSDLVSEEKYAKIDRDLKQSIADIALEEKQIIEPYSENELIIPVDNYNTEDGSKVRSVIERVVRRGISPFTVEIPVHWLGLHMYFIQLDSATITYSECIKIGKTLKISENHLDSCLWYLHYKTGTIRYYSSVTLLKGIVIIKPCVIFFAITEFITSTFTLQNVAPAVQKSFKTLGLFKISEVKYVFDQHKGRLEISFLQFTALLQHLNILVPAHDKNYDYFLPCALVHVPESHMEEASSSVSSLLILFDSGFVPKGVFSGLLGFLCKCGWRIAYDNDGNPQLYRNKAVLSFDIKKYKLYSVSCIMATTANHIQFSVEDHDEFKIICPYIGQMLAQSMPSVCTQLKYRNVWKFGVVCTRPICSSNETLPLPSHQSKFIVVHK